ncbi:hypothetical protein [uncultured Jannaschia sp.]|uniref:hypothetical protein n=1 Tax=uncultured Jannaschia sp. TaxID=293347 RepID=UPI00262976EE|nr:hypothetical protein [uncultured Jannaschia sp.]
MTLLLPVLALLVVAWFVPWGLGKLLPEGVGWLVANGLFSSVLLAVLAALGFVLLYGEAGGVVWREAPWHFAVLSLRSALIWGPMMVLSLANLPRHWTTETW